MPKRKPKVKPVPDPNPRPKGNIRTYVNEYPRFCKLCGDLVMPGEGFIYRATDFHAYGRVWRIWHPNCRGKPIWRTHTLGWIYAVSGCGPIGDTFKVGMTFKHPRERVGDMKFVQRYMPTIDFYVLNPLWISETSDRTKAERGLHALLQPYRADKSEGLGREVYRCDLLTIHDAMLAVTGNAPIQADWLVMEDSGTYHQTPYDHATRVSFLGRQKKYFGWLRETGNFDEWCRRQDMMKPHKPEAMPCGEAVWSTECGFPDCGCEPLTPTVQNRD